MPTRRSLARLLLAVGLVTFGWSAATSRIPATYNTQVAADEPQYLLSALSLWHDHDLDIHDELVDRDFRAFHRAALPRQTEERPDGKELSPHDPLLPVLLAVPVGLGGWFGAKLALAALAGALAALLTWTAVRRFGIRPKQAATVVLLFSLAAPLTTYGTQLYPELPAALAVTIAVAAVLGKRSRWSTVVFALAVVALPWLAVKYAPVAASLAVLGLWRRRSALLAGGFALAGAAYLAIHRAVYQGWTVYASGSHFTGGETTVMGVSPDYLARTQRLYALLVDRGFGLAAWAPLFLLLIPAVVALARRRPPGWAFLLLPLAAGWLNATFVALTMHGWWWPGRQVVVVLPLAVLAVAWWADRQWDHRSVRWSVVGLGAAGLVEWAWLAADGWAGRIRLIIDFQATSDPLYRVWRTVLPDHQHPTALSPVLDGLWLLAFAALAWWGWRSAGGDEDAGAGEGADADVVAVDLDRGGAVRR